MKKILFLTALAVSSVGFSQAPTNLFKHVNKQVMAKTHKTATIINIMDSSYYWNWDASLNNWYDPSRTIYSYNAFYKENGSVSSDFTSNNTTWTNSNRTTGYTYDSNNNILTQIRQSWDNNSSTWVNSRNNISTYDAANNQLSFRSQQWNTGTSTWENVDNAIYTYDASNNLLTSLEQFWNSGSASWENLYRSSMTYGANHQYLTLSFQDWNTSTSSWVNSSNYINLVYTNGDLTNAEIQRWNTTNLIYETTEKFSSTYDANHHELTMTWQDWNSASNAWVNSFKIDYTYDGNGNRSTSLSQNWDTTSNTWVNSSREYEYYRALVGVNELAAQNSNINVYPNPATNYMIISNSDNVLLNEINVVDITGKVVLLEKLAPATSTTLNVASLTPGIYFMILKGEGFTSHKKIVKE